MGNEVIKVTPEADLYVIWSSIVESPLFIGNRAQTLEYLVSDYREDSDRMRRESAEAEQRLVRADTTGSSGIGQFGTHWDDAGLIFEQRGWLPRAQLEPFARIYTETTDGVLNDDQWNRLCDLLEVLHPGEPPFDYVRRER